MYKQLALSFAAGLLLSLPGCGCKDNCSKQTENASTSVDAQAPVEQANTTEATAENTVTQTTEETSAPAKI